MKNSLFNVYVKLDSGENILYNTFSTSLVVLTDEMCDYIRANNISGLKDEDVIALYQMGFLVDDTRDEIFEIEKIRKIEIEKKEQVVTIFSTNCCNARCYYCFETGINYEHMSDETTIKAIDFLKKFYPRKELSIKWFGGEPLYNFKAIREITEQLVAEGYVLKGHITTNGSLITQEIIDFFIKNYSIVTFQITIDDIGPKYNKIKRYAEGDFEDPYRTVVDNCRMVISNKIHVSIRINHLFEKFDNAVSIYNSLGKEFEDLDPQYYLIYLSNITLSGKKTYIRSLQDAEMAVKMQNFNRRHRPVDKNEDKYLLYKHDLLPKLRDCSATNKYNLTITADGNIYKCHRLAQYSEHIIGSVEEGINPQSSTYKFFTDYHVDDSDCRSCCALPICQGSCRSLFLLEGCKVDCDLKKMLPQLIIEYYQDLTKENNEG